MLLKNNSIFAITALFFSSQCISSDDTDMYESYIDIVTDMQLTSFHKVIMNKKEEPYIALEHLAEWLSYEQKCSIESCILFIPQFKTTIDFNNNTIKSNDVYNDYRSELVLFQDGKYWVSFKFIDEFLPIYAKWDLESYRLDIVSNFETLQKRIKKVEASRRLSKTRKKERKSKLFKTKSNYDSQVRLTSTFGWKKNKIESYKHSLEALSDIEEGTLKVSANINNNDYEYKWSYEKLDSDVFKKIKIGSVYYDDSLLFDSLSSESGLLFKKNKHNKATNKFNIREYIGLNTEADIFRNGIYETTINSDQFGYINIYNYYYHFGDRISIKTYSAKGETKTINLTNSRLRNRLLTINDHDYSIYHDLKNGNSIVYLGYGVTYGLTAGAYIIKDDFSTNEVLTYDIQPKTWLMVSGELNENALINTISLNYFEKFPIRTDFGLKLGNYNQNSNYSFKYDYFRTSSYFTYGNNGIENEFYLDEQGYKIRTDIKRKISNTQIIGFTFEHYNEQHSQGNEYKISYTKYLSDYGTANFSYEKKKHDEKISSLLRYRLKNSFNNNYETLLSLRTDYYNGQIHSDFEIDWKINKYISNNVSIGIDNIYIGFSFSTAINNRTIISESPENYGKSYLSGHVTKNDIQNIPIKGITVKIAGKEVTTDDKGYYHFSGIYPNQDLELKIDESDLAVDMHPNTKKHIVNTRPGTHNTLDYNVLSSIGIDGYTNNNEAKFIQIETSDFLKISEISRDGFFVFEKIPKNEFYILNLLDKNKKKISTRKLGNFEDYWVSDIEIN